MTKKDNQSPEDSKSTENNTEENKDLNTLSYEELLKKVADLDAQNTTLSNEIAALREQLEQNEKYNKQYSQQLQNLNEKIITTKVEIEDKPRHDQKANQLAKL